MTFIVLKTKIGLALRAVSFRVDTAALMGVNTNRTIAWTFVFGSALAAVAGVIDGIRYDVRPLMGLMPGLKAFIAAVLGGIGSIPGALVGALLLGLIETLSKYYLPQGYTNTVVQIWVPQGSPAVGKEYDPATHIAVPGNTARQRLIQSGRPYGHS